MLLRLHDECQLGPKTQILICVGKFTEMRKQIQFDVHAHAPFSARAKIPFRLY